MSALTLKVNECEMKVKAGLKFGLLSYFKISKLYGKFH